jgi:threonine dehydrogenase-like Zn-dependent dehydrogenase
MLSTVIHAPNDIRVEDLPDPAIEQPTDAIVRIARTCICGSDLWPYRGVEQTRAPHPIGHEFIGVVEATGTEVRSVK